jgi:transposase
MAAPILTDELWKQVEPCMPPVPHRRRVPGPHPIHDRAVLAGILFVLKSGLPWEKLPAEMGAGSGMTCLRRLRQWQRDGTWERVRQALAGAFAPGEINWPRAEIPPRVQRPGVVRTRRAQPARTFGGTATAGAPEPRGRDPR